MLLTVFTFKIIHYTVALHCPLGQTKFCRAALSFSVFLLRRNVKIPLSPIMAG